MPQAVPPWFARIFWRLNVALQGKDLRADAVEIYFEALGDLPEDVIDTAAIELARTSAFFPRTSEWRDVAAKHRRAQLESLVRNWVLEQCPGARDKPRIVPTCGRTQHHNAHEFVKPR